MFFSSSKPIRLGVSNDVRICVSAAELLQTFARN